MAERDRRPAVASTPATISPDEIAERQRLLARSQAAGEIAEVLAVLVARAKEIKQPFLAHLIEMAHMEAYERSDIAAER